jgi:hypothetical protein
MTAVELIEQGMLTWAQARCPQDLLPFPRHQHPGAGFSAAQKVKGKRQKVKERRKTEKGKGRTVTPQLLPFTFYLLPSTFSTVASG